MIFKKIILSDLTIIVTSVLLAAATVMPTFAKTTTAFPLQKENSARTSPDPARSAQQMTRMLQRANNEIDQRITRLGVLSARIQGMKKVSDANKAGLIGTIQTEITDLTNLKTKITADTDTETMRADLQSITKAYRIYALVMPQIAILVAADRVAVISSNMTAIADKLQTRIAEAQSAGHDVTSLQASLTDMKAKIADARTNAQNAQTDVAALMPDNGDQIKFQANGQILKDSHAKIKNAMDNFRASRKDTETIIKELRIFVKPSSSRQPSTSPTLIP